jgi:hypothetical protein
MGGFEYEQAQRVAETFEKHGVRYLLIGKSGAIVLGYPDTTQDVDVYVEKTPENGAALVEALLELGFPLQQREQDEIRQGKDFVQIRTGPFDIDLVFAPDGIEAFEDAFGRGCTIEGIHVCSIDDIIRSKEASGRRKDRESLPRLRAFREWLAARNGKDRSS